jgi:hypothetical protein
MDHVIGKLMERNHARDLMTFLGQRHLLQAIELGRVQEADGIDASEIAEAIELAEDALRDAEHMELILTELVKLCDAGILPQPVKGRLRKQRRFTGLISSARIVLDRIAQSEKRRNPSRPESASSAVPVAQSADVQAPLSVAG